MVIKNRKKKKKKRKLTKIIAENYDPQNTFNHQWKEMQKFGKFGPLVGSIHVSTETARFLVYAAKTTEVLTYHQIPLKQSYPQDGWIEQDAFDIISSVNSCIEVSAENLRKLDICPEDIVALGITNSPTTVVWNSLTGKPLYSSIACLDMRAAQIVDDLIKKRGNASTNCVQFETGLPLSTDFSAVKIKWLLENIPVVQDAVNDGCCCIGTLDAWLIWNLTGGCLGGVFVTDVTNASKTQLMSLKSLQWDSRLLSYFNIPVQILPKIKSSSEIYGYVSNGILSRIPVAGCICDQQAALLGQGCTQFGLAYCKYSTGAFVLFNTGETIVHSKRGLLTTVAYKLGPKAPALYALEGSVAYAGGAIDWLSQIVDCNGDLPEKKEPNKNGKLSEVGFVPAFAGIGPPHWRKDARGVICGLSHKTSSNELLSALREAICQGICENVRAIELPVARLVIGGPLASCNQFAQMQADLLGIPVVRPLTSECSALGAACAAGTAVGIWPNSVMSPPADLFLPTISDNDREVQCSVWRQALARSLNWFSSSEGERSPNRQSDNGDPLVNVPVTLFFFASVCLMILAERLS